MEAASHSIKARRIYLLLRERIATGDLAAGQRLPSEPVLAAEQGVSRVTLRHALDRLAEEGLVSRRVGAGTFVTDGMLSPVIAVNLADVFTQLKTMGQTTGLRLLAFAYGVPPDTIAEALGLRPGDRTQRSVRVRLIDGQPFSCLTTHVPERIGLTYDEADLASTPLLELLERSGTVVDRASQTLSATLAGPETANALQLEIGTPLLSLTRVVHDAAGAGVEHLHALYRPDRFAFRLDLTRSGDLRRWDLRPPQPQPRRRRAP